jgi:cation:H+ antiporter
LGDVIGANVTICLVALGAGSIIATLPFGKHVFRYGLFALPLGLVCAWFTHDGLVTRFEGTCLVALYAIYVAVIWILERRPPSLGETDELEKAQRAGVRIGKSSLLVLVGIAAMAVGSTLLVAATERFAHAEASQTRLGLTVVGFATGFELVVLAISAARRGATEAAIAGVVGSYAYNVTMTLGAAALARPLQLRDASLLHWPMAAMLIALVLVLLLAAPRKRLARPAGFVLIATYTLFLWLVSKG